MVASANQPGWSPHPRALLPHEPAAGQLPAFLRRSLRKSLPCSARPLMADFRPIQIKEFPGLKEGADPESSYWKKFNRQVLRKEIAPVTHVEFSASEPHLLAYTASTRIEIYDPNTHEVTKTVTRFKDVAFSGSFRSDGQVIAGGSADGTVSVFHLGSRDVLRRWKGHKQPVHVARFGIDKLHLMSGADDSAVRLWEMTTDDCVRTLQGHKDYVRCGAAGTHSPDLWYTGSYDHTVIQWDTRTPDGIAQRFNHGAQVDAMVLFPAGSAMATAGGQFVKIWDLLTGRLMHTFSGHQKAVTALALDGGATRILSGGLDQQVKIYDIRDYSLVHTIKYPSPILSLAVSPDNTHLVAGMNDGTVSIRYKQSKVADVAKQRLKQRALATGTYRYFVRGKGAQPSSDDQQVLAQRAQRLRPYDANLKSYHYAQALDAALVTGQAPVILSLMEELQRRQGLLPAISGRDEQTLKPLMTFLTRNVNNTRYASMLVDVCELVIDRYAGTLGQSTELDQLFVALRSKIRQEVGFQRELQQLSGMLEALIGSAQGGA